MRLVKQALLGMGVLGLLSLSLTGCGRSVAKVNGEKISRKQYVDRLEKMTINMNGQRQQIGSTVLQALIQEKLKLQLAKKEGVEPTEEQVKKRIDALKREGVLENLKKEGFTDEDIHQDALVKQAEVNLFTKGIKVTDKECRDAYNAAKATAFTSPERAEVGLIIAGTKKKADMVRDLLMVKKQEFSAVALRHNDVPELRQSGGRMPAIPKNINLIAADSRPPAPVHKAIFNLKAGDISEPIQAGNVWYIIKVFEHRPEQVKKYELVHDQISEALAINKAQKLYTGDKRKQSYEFKLTNYVEKSEVKINVRRYAGMWKTLQDQIKAAKESTPIGGTAPGAAPTAQPAQ